MSIEYLATISVNPFWGSRLIQHFLQGCKEKTADFDLTLLVLPLVLHSRSRKNLAASRSDSTLHSKLYKNGERSLALTGFEARYRELLSVSKKALIVGGCERRFRVAEKVVLMERLDYKKEGDASIKEYYKAAYYLGVIVSKYKAVEVLRLLGVMDDEDLF